MLDVASGRLAISGSDGLEWNDDILLPLLIRALGGKIVDVGSTAAAKGWRWMHGSRYLLQQPGIRAAHPLKDTPHTLRSSSCCLARLNKRFRFEILLFGRAGCVANS
jgi:hypothetical protein